MIFSTASEQMRTSAEHKERTMFEHNLQLAEKQHTSLKDEDEGKNGSFVYIICMHVATFG